jgi:hypothetical protein
MAVNSESLESVCCRVATGESEGQQTGMSEGCRLNKRKDTL